MPSFRNLFPCFKHSFCKNILSLVNAHLIFVFLGKAKVKHLSFSLDVLTTCISQRRRAVVTLLHYTFTFNHTVSQNSPTTKMTCSSKFTLLVTTT